MFVPLKQHMMCLNPADHPAASVALAEFEAVVSSIKWQKMKTMAWWRYPCRMFHSLDIWLSHSLIWLMQSFLPLFIVVLLNNEKSLIDEVELKINIDLRENFMVCITTEADLMRYNMVWAGHQTVSLVSMIWRLALIYMQIKKPQDIPVFLVWRMGHCNGVLLRLG